MGQLTLVAAPEEMFVYMDQNSLGNNNVSEHGVLQWCYFGGLSWWTVVASSCNHIFLEGTIYGKRSMKMFLPRETCSLKGSLQHVDRPIRIWISLNQSISRTQNRKPSSDVWGMEYWTQSCVCLEWNSPKVLPYPSGFWQGLGCP